MVVITHLNPGARKHSARDHRALYDPEGRSPPPDDAEIEPNCVYVLLPSDAILSIANRRLAVIKAEAGHRERKPIDVFFSSLAIDIGEYAAGAVLSGGDGDGTLGIKAIKERGGMTLAQTRNGHGPGHPHMPDSAISSGFVDFAVPAEEMGAKLVEFAKGLKTARRVVGWSRR